MPGYIIQFHRLHLESLFPSVVTRGNKFFGPQPLVFSLSAYLASRSYPTIEVALTAGQRRPVHIYSNQGPLAKAILKGFLGQLESIPTGKYCSVNAWEISLSNP